MLKFTKHLLLVLGAIVIIGAVGLLLYQYTMSLNSLKVIVGTATANNSNPEKYAAYTATIQMVWITLIAAIVGGVLFGLGIGIPSATFKQKYEARQAEATRQLAASSAADAAAVADATPDKTAKS